MTFLKQTLKRKKNFIAPFHGWSSTASSLEPLQGGSLLFTTWFTEISDSHLIDLGRMKGSVELGATQWFWTRDPGLAIQRLNHLAIATTYIRYVMAKKLFKLACRIPQVPFYRGFFENQSGRGSSFQEIFFVEFFVILHELANFITTLRLLSKLFSSMCFVCHAWTWWCHDILIFEKLKFNISRTKRVFKVKDFSVLH